MRLPWILLLATALLLTGCTAEENSEEGKPKVNMQEAAERADKILDDTFAAIKPPVNWTHDENSVGSCDVSRRRTVMTVISSERRGNFFGVVENHWKGQGFTRQSSNPGKIPTTIFQTEDGFQVMLLVGRNGQAAFEVMTPCVDESDVSPPKANTVGPNYAGSEVPAPNARSDFWSANARATAKPPAATP